MKTGHAQRVLSIALIGSSNQALLVNPRKKDRHYGRHDLFKAADETHTKARHEDGVLNLELTKKEVTNNKEITIEWSGRSASVLLLFGVQGNAMFRG